MTRFSEDDLNLYFAVAECRAHMRRGVNTVLAVSAACMGRDVDGERVLEMARKAHHACGQARHRYKHYQRGGKNRISQPNPESRSRAL